MTATLFTNVRVIDGDGNEPFSGEVLVEGNRIKQVAKAGEGTNAPDARTVDGGGQTLMPGLIEAHAHISFCNTADLESLGDLPPENTAHPANGMGSILGHPNILPLRE